ncbi:MAG: hypothetical protein ACI4MF_10310 [Candidatus Faecivicinus sp.]
MGAQELRSGGELEERMQGIDETLRLAQAALNEISDDEQSAVRESFANLMGELERLSGNLRAMTEGLAPRNGDNE